MQTEAARSIHRDSRSWVLVCMRLFTDARDGAHNGWSTSILYSGSAVR